jgi:hypothetical protein
VVAVSFLLRRISGNYQRSLDCQLAWESLAARDKPGLVLAR